MLYSKTWVGRSDQPTDHLALRETLERNHWIKHGHNHRWNPWDAEMTVIRRVFSAHVRSSTERLKINSFSLFAEECWRHRPPLSIVRRVPTRPESKRRPQRDEDQHLKHVHCMFSAHARHRYNSGFRVSTDEGYREGSTSIVAKSEELLFEAMPLT